MRKFGVPDAKIDQKLPRNACFFGGRLAWYTCPQFVRYHAETLVSSILPVSRQPERSNHDAAFVVHDKLTENASELRQATHAQVHGLRVHLFVRRAVQEENVESGPGRETSGRAHEDND